MSSNFMQRYPTFRDVGLVEVLHHVTMKSLNSLWLVQVVLGGAPQ